MELESQVAHKAYNTYCLALCRKFEEICRQSGQGGLSEDATFKLKHEGAGASHRNSPGGPGIRSSKCKGPEADRRQEHATPLGLGLFEFSQLGFIEVL